MNTLTSAKTSNKSTINTHAIAEVYRSSAENFFMTSKPPKKRYKTINQLLKESVFVGSMSHGFNFIS